MIIRYAFLTVMGFVRAGRVRALAVSTRQASPSVPGAEAAELPGC